MKAGCGVIRNHIGDIILEDFQVVVCDCNEVLGSS